MLNERIFTLITRLIYGRWTRHYDEHHSPYEDSLTACLGPLRLSANTWLRPRPPRRQRQPGAPPSPHCAGSKTTKSSTSSSPTRPTAPRRP